jgi:hypothetical protein
MIVNGEHGETVAIGRIAVRLPNPGKVFFPGDGVMRDACAQTAPAPYAVRAAPAHRWPRG